MCQTEVYPFSITDLHTTPLGAERIRKNLNLPECQDVVSFCRCFILEDFAKFERKGKKLVCYSRSCNDYSQCKQQHHNNCA